MKQIFPTKKQLLLNFSSCINWEERYMYLIELGTLLPKLPKKFRIPEYLINGCQSYTWIAVIYHLHTHNNEHNNSINLYGDSDSTIIKGIIVIIFSLYQNLNIQKIPKLDAQLFLDTLNLNQHLTISRSQGIHAILHSIKKQISFLLLKNKIL